MTATSEKHRALASRDRDVDLNYTLDWDGKLMGADLNSDEECLALSQTTRADSAASTLADFNSEDDECLSEALTNPRIDRCQTERHEVQVVLKNTFVHVSDGIDAERQKAIRRVQSCPPSLGCEISSRRMLARQKKREELSGSKAMDEPNEGVQSDKLQVLELAPGSARSKHDGRVKCVQMTQKSGHLKVQHKQHGNCSHAPCNRKGFNGWRLRNALSPCTLSCFITVLIILWGKIGEDHSIAASPSHKSDCFSGPSPSAVKVTSDPRLPDSTDFLPTITLYAPCLLESFATTAATYQEAAAAWNYVESHVASKVELRNFRETPIVHWKDLHDADHLQDFLIYNMMPKVGKLNAFTSQFYGSIQEEYGGIPGLIIGLFDPDMDDEQVNDMYRPMLAELAEAVDEQYRVAYMNTRVDKLWIQCEFGVTSFPTIAVIPSYPGKAFLYNGDLSTKSLLLYLQDIDAGCLSHGFRPLAQAQVCDAMPVLRD